MEVVIGIIAGLVGIALGYATGVSRGRAAGVSAARDENERSLEAVLADLRRGRTPDSAPDGSVQADIQAALSQGWAPREAERQAALEEAVGRVSAFLDKNVRGPLASAGERTQPAELRERIDRALGALQDLDFFLSETPAEREGTDLSKLAQRVAKEFVDDQGLGVRLALSDASVRAAVNPQALMDALYLVLHNAGRFGHGRTVDLEVENDGGRATITVRDRGNGFSEEAFRRAFDPFYSTSEEGLGLGLPHARRTVEEMGGRIELRNVPDGGAEVEISFDQS